MELAWRRGHITQEEFEDVFDQYEKLISQLVLFEQTNKSWRDKLLIITILAPFALFLMLI